MTFDLKSAGMQGPYNFGRVRVLWRDGLLKAFNRQGVVLEVISTQPKRLKGYLRAWQSETDGGTIVLKAKCMTCGGRSWWRIMRLSEDELWSKAW